ncbi:MAG: flagellar hook-associated protein FlgK [Deltaproteobacteria bacterium]|nr:flagellar hook-associated protein FlgK [Deltaproteobacteria bacterium]
MSLFGILGVGANGMTAQGYASGVASNNASNVNTVGYSRRMAQLEPIEGPPGFGLGARANGQRRVIDQFLERRVLGGSSSSGEADARASALSILDATFSDAAGNLGDAMDALTTALGDLSSYPAEPGARVTVLARAEQMAQAFNRAGDDLATARADVNERIAKQVGQVNSQIEQIADLGRKISKAEVSGQEASDLRDKRDQLVRQVANFVPVKVIPEENGQISLLLAGSLPLVSPDGTAHPLTTVTDATSGDMLIQQVVAGAPRDIGSLITSGSIGGLIAARDGGLTTARDSLDQLAFDTAAGYNTAHNAGFGLDGVGARNLFTPVATVPGAAQNFSLSVDVAGNADALAAAGDAAAMPGDNIGALALLAVADQDLALGGTATLGEGFAALLATSGSDVQSALVDQDQAEAVRAQLDSLRESVSGVSTDEEMVSLMRFQRGYQASLKVVQTANEMLGELMNLKR